MKANAFDYYTRLFQSNSTSILLSILSTSRRANKSKYVHGT